MPVQGERNSRTADAPPQQPKVSKKQAIAPSAEALWRARRLPEVQRRTMFKSLPPHRQTAVSANASQLGSKLGQGHGLAGVIGLGYVGLPLAVEIANSGFAVVGVDVSDEVVAGVNAGVSHIHDVSSEALFAHVQAGRIRASTDPAELRKCDAICICVPTPLNKIKDPDLSFVVSAAGMIRDNMRPGQLVILESTTYPGTTREVLLPLLEESGLKLDEDFFLCFSPERVDPGNPIWQTRNTPKVIGGVSQQSLQVSLAFYSRIFDTLVPVESAEAAELVKVYENTFRMVNIALANEMALTCDRLGLDVWGVIEAAASKPFGFMKFVPGPGLGGHCIPLDPHYLSWKMRTLSFKTRLIELASEINADMPSYVVRKVASALNDSARALRGSWVLVLGIAYKRDVDDIRESPALEVIRLLQNEGAQVLYHDPFCSVIDDDAHTKLKNLPMRSVPLTSGLLASLDAVVLVTDHTAVDYNLIVEHAPLVIDTRGALRNVRGSARVVGLSGVETPRSPQEQMMVVAL
jgi:UDP-N-acetyl-D-glucosamine dehydrogenase